MYSIWYAEPDWTPEWGRFCVECVALELARAVWDRLDRAGFQMLSARP